MKTGLIMEGGAMRGMFTCGVIDLWMEHHITFDGAAGVSAGAVFGCNYKSYQIGRAIRYNKKYCNDKRFVSFRSLFATGNIYNVEFGYGELINELDVFDRKTFCENPMEFYAVCTDVETGEAIYHRCDKGDEKDVTYMRASASMPVFARNVQVDGMLLSDGGTADSIPLTFMEEQGYDRNVVILTQPLGYEKKPNKLLPLIRLLLRKTPVLVRALEQRHIIYNDTIEEICDKENAGEILVIRPPHALNIGAICHKPEELERVYQLGRQEGERQLDRVRQFLSLDAMV